ncbi:MAG: protein translocase subunit SecF [Thermomicrobia bacterium]|nr:protein translocase subunit SecF [Thermomicrobia bacterium]
MLDLVHRRKLWYTLSLLIIVPGVLALLVWHLRLGIDFTGGSSWELQFPRTDIQSLDVRQILIAQGEQDPQVQVSTGTAQNTQTVLIKLKSLEEGSPQKTKLSNALKAQYGNYTELRLDSVGPTVGASVSKNSILAVIAASVGILLYLAWAFRKVKRPFLYGSCAIVAMLHDVLVVVGIFAILGKVVGTEVDSLFVTAVLTVIGFSVHDTIVVFDRIRENQIRRPAMPFDEVVNYSLNQTIVRSINTSLTVLFTLLALVLFGGATIREFVLALLLGVASGTYSSIFNASQLLVSWERGEIQRLAFWRRGRGTPRAAASGAGD